jgi:hypothetical protein
VDRLTSFLIATWYNINFNRELYLNGTSENPVFVSGDFDVRHAAHDDALAACDAVRIFLRVEDRVRVRDDGREKSRLARREVRPEKLSMEGTLSRRRIGMSYSAS